MDLLLCNVADRLDHFGSSERGPAVREWFAAADEGREPQVAAAAGGGAEADTAADWFEFCWSITRYSS